MLELLGVEPELGARFTLTFDVDGHETTQTFTLSGWWEYDEAIVANHVLLPESRVDALLDEAGVNPNAPEDGMTGAWNLDVMLKSGSAHIERDMEQILAGHGFQSEDAAGEYYIRSGVTGATPAPSSPADWTSRWWPPLPPCCCSSLYLAYLIIYNVFQISVTNDIRFYGLLKTIGTTGRQLRRIIRYQALALSLAGIPGGAAAGLAGGGGSHPGGDRPAERRDQCCVRQPRPLCGSALFALVTVLLSCRKPGRMAAKVSPVEAVRYTEGSKTRRKAGKRAGKGVVPALHGPGPTWAGTGARRWSPCSPCVWRWCCSP